VIRSACRFAIISIALCVPGVSLLAADFPDPKPGSLGMKQLDKAVTTTVKLNYLLYLPKDYGKDPAKKWPVIMFLHGSGESGTDLNRVKAHGPPKVVESGKRDLPFVIVSPQCPADRWWKPDEVIALLDDILEKYKTDADRVYLTGLSMGGFGTWRTAIDYPDRFAAIAPLCGGGNPYEVRRIKDVPTWAFHGVKDPAVPVAASEQMVGVLQQAGGDVKLTRYPEAGHDCWTVTYNGKELYNWFLEHKRGEKHAAANAAKK
jgi:predicted peptidase